MPITPAELCDIEEIKQLKASYFRYLDTKQWERLRGLFTDDAVFEGTSKKFDGPDDFVATNRERLGPAVTIHQGHMPEIRILSLSRARGIWAMFDWVEFSQTFTDGPMRGARGFTGLGHYQEEYRKTPAGWRIARLRLTRLKLDPLVGAGVLHDLPAGRLWTRQNDWLGGEE